VKTVFRALGRDFENYTVCETLYNNDSACTDGKPAAYITLVLLILAFITDEMGKRVRKEFNKEEELITAGLVSVFIA